LPLKCAVVSLNSVVKERLNSNTDKVCNCLIQFLLTIILSFEERIFISAQRLHESTVLSDVDKLSGEAPAREIAKWCREAI
jgi:hypothetical protein